MTFAPVARYTSIKSIIAIASTMGWKLHQMDVKTFFLNGIVEEEVYIEQPKGLSSMVRSLMYACRKGIYMDSSKNPVLGMDR